MTVEHGIATQGSTLHHALEFVLGGDHAIAKGRGELFEGVAVVRVHGEVDAEALFGPVDEFLAEGRTDVDIRKALAVTHDRRHAEDAEHFPPGFHSDDRFAGLDRFDHGAAAGGDVVAENLRRVDAIERHRRRHLEGDQRNPLRNERLVGVAKQRRQGVAIALGDGVADRRQGGDHGTDRERGPPLIVDGGDDAVILQLQLLVEREPRQGALLSDRKASEDGAGCRDRQRNGENQSGSNRSNLEHGESGTPRRDIPQAFRNCLTTGRNSTAGRAWPRCRLPPYRCLIASSAAW